MGIGGLLIKSGNILGNLGLKGLKITQHKQKKPTNLTKILGLSNVLPDF